MARKKKFDYEIALSFAGEDRKTAELLADLLKDEEIRVFYDLHEQAELWGKDLYQHLQVVYRDKAQFCIILVSKAYAKKLWTRHELKQAQARAFKESHEYILPIRIDDTEIPGLNHTVGYIDLRHTEVYDVINLVIKKLYGEDPDEVLRLTWDGEMVEYNGTSMASFWPKKIKLAQKKKVYQITREFTRIPYGEEYGMKRQANKHPCRDCGVLKGQFHVSGCCIEQCPACECQILSCDCRKD
jgi:hypothetical protein